VQRWKFSDPEAGKAMGMARTTEDAGRRQLVTLHARELEKDL
jgi:hypothetical protein